jgi:hypothetical protein
MIFSVRESSGAGTAAPICRAIFLFTVSSIFVGCATAQAFPPRAPLT